MIEERTSDARCELCGRDHDSHNCFYNAIRLSESDKELILKIGCASFKPMNNIDKVITILGKYGALGVSDISERSNLSERTVRLYMRNLARSGTVGKRMSQDDGRKIEYFLNGVESIR